MTRREIYSVRAAIRLVMGDSSEFMEGMAILCKLAKIRSVSLQSANAVQQQAAKTPVESANV